MLDDKQIDNILRGKLSDVGGHSLGAIQRTLGRYWIVDFSIRLGAASTNAVAKILKTDYKTENVEVNSQTDIPRLVKKYFNDRLISEENENGIYYAVGVKASGFFNMNPCVLEIVSKSNNIQVSAHAKEGLIKQKTCSKAIASLKAYLLGTVAA